MKSQPNKNYISNDKVMTPIGLAEKLVAHFNPQGKGLEPCCGNGNILQFLNNADWCEILLSLGLIKTEKVEECKEIKSMTTKN